MISIHLYPQRLYETGTYLRPEYSALIYFKTPVPSMLIGDRPLIETDTVTMPIIIVLHECDPGQ